MTKREMFVAIMNVAEVSANEEMRDFLQHQIELLDSRKGGIKKPTKTQELNVSIKDTIYEVLAESETPLRVKDLLTDSRLADYSSSKITALLRQMLPETGDGRLVRVMDKKTAYFTVA